MRTDLEVAQVIPVPYISALISCFPIFLIVGFFPARADGDFFVWVDLFVDQYLLGVVGFWLSNFPFSTKIAANYISLCAPVFTIAAFFLLRKKMVVDERQYLNLSVVKFVLSLLVFIVFFVAFVSLNYFYDVDLAHHNVRFRRFGEGAFMYSLFASVVMFAFYVMVFCSYFAFFYIPRLLFRRLVYGQS